MDQPPSSDELLVMATCGPVIQEVMQGFAESPRRSAFRESLMALPRLSDPMSTDIYMEAAEIYRDGRRRGYTLRSSTDCLIAAVAIINQVPLWHADRDYQAIAQYTRLSIYQRRFAHA
jgi:predicted nucleic acid-binding protein